MLCVEKGGGESITLFLIASRMPLALRVARGVTIAHLRVLRICDKIMSHYCRLFERVLVKCTVRSLCRCPNHQLGTHGTHTNELIHKSNQRANVM